MRKMRRYRVRVWFRWEPQTTKADRAGTALPWPGLARRGDQSSCTQEPVRTERASQALCTGISWGHVFLSYFSTGMERTLSP